MDVIVATVGHNTKICFYCEKEILPDERKFLYAIDRPYINLWFHRDHYRLIKDDMVTFILENEIRFKKELEKWMKN